MSKQDLKSVKPISKTIASRNTKKSVKWLFPMTKGNLMFLGIALGVILLGYGLMATGITEEPAFAGSKWDNPLAVSVAPIVLVIGYCVLIPIGIMRNFSKSKEEVNQ